MNIKDLEYYHDLVTTKNFSIVAQHFHVSQPTITMAIKRLEETFATKFFIRDRSHNTLTVTLIGQQFDQHVQNMLNELSVAQKEISRAKQEQIRFGLPPIIGNYYFPSFTPALLRNGLLSRLEVVDHGSASLQKLLLAGDIDMALLGSLTPLQQAAFQTKIIAKAPIKIIVGKNHPLAAKSAVAFADIAKQPFIMLDDEYVHAQAFRQMARAMNKRPKIIFKTSDVQILKTLVANNSGISFLTDIAVKPSDKLTTLSLTDVEQPEFVVSLATRSANLLSPQMKQLWSILSHPINN